MVTSGIDWMTIGWMGCVLPSLLVHLTTYTTILVRYGAMRYGGARLFRVCSMPFENAAAFSVEWWPRTLRWSPVDRRKWTKRAPRPRRLRASFLECLWLFSSAQSRHSLCCCSEEDSRRRWSSRPLASTRRRFLQSTLCPTVCWI